MSFGEKIRELRRSKRLTLRELAAKVGVGFTYLSKIENNRLEVGHSPSERLIHKLAIELEGVEDELMLLADKVPELIRQRVIERPDVFRVFAQLEDGELEKLCNRVRTKEE